MSQNEDWNADWTPTASKLAKMEAGIVFCEAFNIEPKIEASRTARIEPASEKQVEAIRRFGGEVSSSDTKFEVTQALTHYIKEAREHLPRKVWPSTEALLRAKEKDAKDEFAEFKEQRSTIRATRAQAIAKLDGKCHEPTCDVTDDTVLEIDHLYDDGATHRKMPTGRGPAFYADVVEHGRRYYQLLCGTHHNKKTAEARERAKKERDE